MKVNAKISEDQLYEIEFIDGQVYLDGEQLNIDISKISDNKYHLILDHQSINVEIESAEYNNKQLSLIANDEMLNVELSDSFDLLLEQMGMNAAGNSGVENIHAPMPGLVLDILVAEGDEIEDGQPLLVLEAMKMENVIKAVGNGKVKSIPIEKKNAVDKGQLLIEMEE